MVRLLALSTTASKARQTRKLRHTHCARGSLTSVPPAPTLCLPMAVAVNSRFLFAPPALFATTRRAMETEILKSIDTQGDIDSRAYAAQANVDHEELIGKLIALELKEYIVRDKYEVNGFALTPDGEDVLNNGSFEVRFFNAVAAEGTPLADLKKSLDKSTAKVGMNVCMQNKWVTIDKSGGAPVVRRTVDTVEETNVPLLKRVAAGDADLAPEELAALKKLKLIKPTVQKGFKCGKGPAFSLELRDEAAELTAEMIQSGEWRNKSFKKYNFDALGVPPASGHLHPLLKVRSEYRQIFLEMGYEEMPTNNFVESSFWNFDALFQPQQHPARDMHDTFFIKDPAVARDIPEDYMKVVKETHEHGGFGSRGYHYDWKESEARKNILRTHTTAVSSRMLRKLAQDMKETGTFTPKKYFSIDRVFRNETLDATHLAEFHQIEGVVIDRNLTLGDLIGTLNQFFGKLGITNLRFKPTYNPYTEPSMEIFTYHEGLGKLVEIGNSGVFRPEMLEPMGFPSDVTAIAWGLSVERPAMIMYKCSNIRELFGHKISASFIEENPICRLDRS